MEKKNRIFDLIEKVQDYIQNLDSVIAVVENEDGCSKIEVQAMDEYDKDYIDKILIEIQSRVENL